MWQAHRKEENSQVLKQRKNIYQWSKKTHPKTAQRHWWFPLWIFLAAVEKNSAKQPTSNVNRLKSRENLPAKSPSLCFLKMTALEPLFWNEPPILLFSKQNIQPVTNIWRNWFEGSHPFQSSWPTLHWETLEQTSSDVFEMSWALVRWWKAWLVAAYWILLGLKAVLNTRSSPEPWIISLRSGCGYHPEPFSGSVTPL